MDEPLSSTPLPDRDTFARVWQRVMPNADQSPLALAPPAPEAPIHTTAPVPKQTLFTSASTMDEEILKRSMDKICSEASALVAMARRGGRSGQHLSAMASDCRRACCRLSVAYFLVTGQQYQPHLSTAPVPVAHTAALRERWVAARQWEQLCTQAASASHDALLQELYLDLARGGKARAERIWSLLEQICLSS